MKLTDFNYLLPPELIARYPLAKRSASRLMVLNRHTKEINHRQFTDIISLLSPNDLLIFNNTKVIPARLLGCKETGGRVEVLVERILNKNHFLAHLRASKRPKNGSYLLFDKNIKLEVIAKPTDLYELRYDGEESILQMIELIGEIPIPPYFNRAPDAIDKDRYQTIYAEEAGSVAAPTAGLHFDEELFQQLKNKNIEMGFVTLHVGAGTFSPVRVENIADHRMHSEYVEVSKEICDAVHKTKERGGRVIAVGTTSARSLESASQTGNIQSFCGNTDIFIYPTYEFKCIDALITNFHLPCSSLLMLVAAFAGFEYTLSAYQLAITEKYRFFSYGDAMFIY